MALQFMMKNPILMIGILMMVIFLLNVKKLNLLGENDRFNPTSCKSAIVMLKRRGPSNYQIECQKNDMIVTIDREVDKELPPSEKAQKKIFYMELANHITFIARNSLVDSLQNVNNVSVIYNTPEFKISAFTKGEDISRLSSLTDIEMISLHLKNTVKIQEIRK